MNVQNGLYLEMNLLTSIVFLLYISNVLSQTDGDLDVDPESNLTESLDPGELSSVSTETEDLPSSTEKQKIKIVNKIPRSKVTSRSTVTVSVGTSESVDDETGATISSSSDDGSDDISTEISSQSQEVSTTLGSTVGEDDESLTTVTESLKLDTESSDKKAKTSENQKLINTKKSGNNTYGLKEKKDENKNKSKIVGIQSVNADNEEDKPLKVGIRSDDKDDEEDKPLKVSDDFGTFGDFEGFEDLIFPKPSEEVWNSYLEDFGEEEEESFKNALCDSDDDSCMDSQLRAAPISPKSAQKKFNETITMRKRYVAAQKVGERQARREIKDEGEPEFGGLLLPDDDDIPSKGNKRKKSKSKGKKGGNKRKSSKGSKSKRNEPKKKKSNLSECNCNYVCIDYCNAQKKNEDSDYYESDNEDEDENEDKDEYEDKITDDYEHEDNDDENEDKDEVKDEYEDEDNHENEGKDEYENDDEEY